MSPTNRIIIVGGGASGTLLAVHLLVALEDVLVTIIEQRMDLGRGLAYSTEQYDHVLNVAAGGMSAFADDPHHFRQWLIRRGIIEVADSFAFVARRHFGAYLADVLEQIGNDGRLSVVQDAAIDVRPGSGGVEVLLESGVSLVGHTAVLAVGHETQQARSRGVAVRVGSEADTPLATDAPVLILGSGLSMVDAWLTLEQRRHSGPIIVVSRHGLLPQAHRQVDPLLLAAADIPFGTDLHYFVRWFRDIVDEVTAPGGDWRSVVDALRPFNQRIWQNWSLGSRRRFLSHLRPFWNIHRHRLPPLPHRRVQLAVRNGQVELRAGDVLALERSGDNVVATIRPKRGTATYELTASRVYDCGGVSVDVRQSSNPAVRSIVERGDARPDALGIGLDVDTDCHVLDAHGVAHSRLYAIGPLTRGTFFEIEAIPDIRVQAADLAERLATIQS